MVEIILSEFLQKYPALIQKFNLALTKFPEIMQHYSKIILYNISDSRGEANGIANCCMSDIMVGIHEHYCSILPLHVIGHELTHILQYHLKQLPGGEITCEFGEKETSWIQRTQFWTNFFNSQSQEKE